jgi:hypothetical protein
MTNLFNKALVHLLKFNIEIKENLITFREFRLTNLLLRLVREVNRRNIGLNDLSLPHADDHSLEPYRVV